MMSRMSLSGQTLGARYKVNEILGQGGMSAVYKAYDPNLKRVVAVKVIHSHLADDPKFLTRFEEEATAVAQLRHPNIVQVFDFNHDEDLYYMVQEFVPGETLQERLRHLSRTGKRIPVAEAIQITLDICDATGYAHRRGMIHRDIKPANIMLAVHGKAILMDFGIVKITGSEKHTATGAVVGTALYMPPELIRGEAPDPRSDLYSLGVTLFEIISGRPPFEADSAMTLMMMHLREPVPDVRELRPEIPEELIAVITKSLSKDQNERYDSMDEMGKALKEVINHLQSGVPAPATLIEQETEAEKPINTQDSEATLAEDRPLPKSPIASSGTATQAEAKPTQADLGEMDRLPPKPPENTHRGTGDAAHPAASLAQGAIPASGKKTIRYALWIGGAVLLLVVILGGIFIALGNRGNGEDQENVAATQPTSTQVAALVAINIEKPESSPSPSPTSLPTASPTGVPSATVTSTPTQTPSPTITLSPTLSPTPTPSPTPTIPPGVPFVRINGVALDIAGNYVVNYETFEYTEKLPGMHIHFFFNTVLPEQAGSPGTGPWFLYGGPRPFMGFQQSERPQNATQLCALVANPNHSVQANSGTCFNLPDVVLVVPTTDANCLLGPNPAFEVFTPVFAGQSLLVRGMSPDENWWNIASPQDMNQSCWLARETTSMSGDISTLGLIEPPPLPEGATITAFSVQINNITVNEQNRYVVEYVTNGFTEELPGVHLHFFFNNVNADQVGISGTGNRLMYGGPSPFRGYAITDRPQEATQMCVLVASPDHSILLNSGNCMQLPDVPAP